VGLAVGGGEGEEGGGLGASVYQFQGKSPRMQLREVLPYLRHHQLVFLSKKKKNTTLVTYFKKKAPNMIE